MRKYINVSFLTLFITVVICSCSSSKKITYLQDIQPGVSVMIQEPQPIKFEPGDQIRIIVHSRDKEVAEVFNITSSSNNINGSNNKEHSQYIVDAQGYVELPVLGRMKIGGLTREEAAMSIKYRLLESRMVKDPIVTIDYSGMGYTVLGEVKTPGRKNIERDQITLLEAIGEAGDLTIDGVRDNILVLRTEDGKQTPYRVNLLDTRSLYSSPVYYVQQNDVIYVEPNIKKATQSTATGSSILTPGFWMSTVSAAISLILVLTRVF